MFEKSQIQQGFAKAHQSYAAEAMAQQSMVHQLMRMLPKDQSAEAIKSILEIGCGSGFLTRELARFFNPERAIINDLSAVWEAHVNEFFPSQKWKFMAADAEEQQWNEQYHLIASSACIQWFSNPSGFIKTMYERLLPGGIMLMSSFGANNLCEIKSFTGQGLNYPSPQTLLESIKKYRSMEIRDTDSIQLRFQSPLEVLKHLKNTGVNRSLAQFWTPGQLKRFSEHYTQFQLEDSSFPLTYHPIYFCIQK